MSATSSQDRWLIPPPKPKPLPIQSVKWPCPCGRRTWAHIKLCVCGEAKPKE